MGWAKRWYRWLRKDWKRDCHGCPFCGSPFLILKVSLYRHPSYIIKSKLGSMNGEAQCGTCDKKFNIMRIGEGKR